MTVQTLSSVTLQTIENYRTAAIFAVDAYRVGSLRLIDAVNGGLVKNIYPRTSKLAPQLTKTVSQVRGDLSDIIVTGVGEVAARTDKVIEASSNAMAGGVSKVAKYASTLDNPIVVNGLEAAVRFSLPGAQVARTVSAKVVEGADALARVAGGKKTSVKKAAASAKKATTTAKRKVVRKAAATKTAVRKAVVRKTAAPSKTVAAAKKPRAKRQAAAAA